MAVTIFKLLLRELRTSVRISRNSSNLPASAGSCLVATIVSFNILTIVVYLTEVLFQSVL